MYGKDNGALTGAPLCHRRWHVSRPRSRSSVVLESDRERGGEDKKNPLRESNNLGTQRVRASRWEDWGKRGERKAGDARGPLPGKSTRSYPRRGSLLPDLFVATPARRCQRSAPLNWRRRRLLGSRGGREGGREASGRGTTSPVCVEKLDYVVSFFASAFPKSPQEELRKVESYCVFVSPRSVELLTAPVKKRTHARTYARTHTHARRSVSRILGSTRSLSLLQPFIPHSCNI